MKPYSIFSKAARFIALLSSTIGLTVALGATAYAVDNTPLRESTASASEAVAEGRPCGGPKGLTCRTGLTCVDNPSDNCDPRKEGMKCPGTCMANIVKEGSIEQPCGGPDRLACRGGMICVDDPSDDCNPLQDGMKCKGRCVPET